MAISGQNPLNSSDLIRQQQDALSRGAASGGVAAILEGNHRHRLHAWWWAVSARLSRRHSHPDGRGTGTGDID